MKRRVLVSMAAAIAAAYPMAAVHSETVPVQPKQKAVPLREPTVGQLMVKLRSPTVSEKVQALGSARMSKLSVTAGVQLHAVRAMSGDASVVRLEQPLPLSEAQQVAARLANDPNIEWAVPDLPVKRLAEPPDTSYTTRQWNLFPPTQTFTSQVLGSAQTKMFTATGGANLPSAWDVTQGATTIRVAIVDTGVTLTHPDLPTAAMVPGYDFISSDALASSGAPANFVANDGDGRDADPTDPGDWATSQDATSYPNVCGTGDVGSSSWHGTHMSGVAAAAWTPAPPPAGTSTAGIAPGVRILPVRVLGKCGGVSSDVIDGIRWAAGLSVPNVPANANPAHVINMSLGSSGGACSAAYQQAIDQIVAAGKVVVVSSGNDGAPAVSSPANCNGVIAVTAHVINGDNADYANVGPEIAISSPGGGAPTQLASNPALDSNDRAYYIWSTYLFGATTPNSADSTGQTTGAAIAGLTGTSPAAPHVSGTAALILSIYPQASATQVRSYIRQSARPHPTGGYCLSNLFRCGTGLLDASGAVALAQARAPGVSLGNARVVAPGANVAITGTVAADAARTISSQTWSQVSGPTVTLSSTTGASTSFTAPATGTVRLRLTATDNTSQSGNDTIAVRVNSAPTSTAPAAQTVTAGQTLQFQLSATDADADPVLFTPVSGPTGATLSGSGAFQWSNAGPAGNYTLVYNVSDGIAAPSSNITVNITVNSATPPPPPPPPPPPSGGGDSGGGATPLWQALLLIALGLAGAVRRRR